MRVSALVCSFLISTSFSAVAAVNEEESNDTARVQFVDDFEITQIDFPEDYDLEDIDLWDVYFVDESFNEFPLDDMTDAQIFGEDGLVSRLEEMEETASKTKPKTKKKSKRRIAGRGCVARDGSASWYGPGFHGKRTASGQRFDQGSMTAAHRSIRFGSLVRVTYRGRSVVVRINDNGPHTRGRVIDLSKAAAKAVGLMASGSGHVSLQIVRCG